MTKAKIDVIPKPELRAQPINANHRQEFVIEFTRSVFLDRIVAATPSDMGNWKKDLDTQIAILRAAFPLLQKKDMREVYGRRRDIYRVLRWEHTAFNNALCDLNTYRMAQRLLNTDRLQENIEGRACTFGNALQEKIKTKMPNVQASEDYRKEMELETHISLDRLTDKEINARYIWLPYDIQHMADLLTEKKEQNPETGEVTRTPIIKSQFAAVISKSVQKRILTWVNRKRNNISTESMEAEMNLMYEFSRELHEGIRIIRNTKQFQERLPDMFDDFCFITGLGQANGKDLICGTEMGTVNTILAQYKK